MRTSMIYSMRTSPRWLRHLTAGMDHELAALCRQHWQKPREQSAAAPARGLEAMAPEAAPVEPCR